MLISPIESRFWCTQKSPCWPSHNDLDENFALTINSSIANASMATNVFLWLMASLIFVKGIFSPFLRFIPEFYLMVQKCWNRKEKHERDNKELFPTQSLNLMRLNYAISSESLFVRIFSSNLSRFFLVSSPQTSIAALTKRCCWNTFSTTTRGKTGS